ncbi:MAG: hypothetical protein AAFZ58_14560, partial [Pseudomonadota bacterium]
FRAAAVATVLPLVFRLRAIKNLKFCAVSVIGVRKQLHTKVFVESVQQFVEFLTAFFWQSEHQKSCANSSRRRFVPSRFIFDAGRRETVARKKSRRQGTCAPTHGRNINTYALRQRLKKDESAGSKTCDEEQASLGT